MARNYLSYLLACGVVKESLWGGRKSGVEVQKYSTQLQAIDPDTGSMGGRPSMGVRHCKFFFGDWFFFAR